MSSEQFLIDRILKQFANPDNLFSSFTGERIGKEYAKVLHPVVDSYFQGMLKARRFIMAPSAMQIVCDTPLPEPKTLVRQMEVARPHQEWTWIEYDNLKRVAYNDQLRGRGDLNRDTPLNVGWLLHAPGDRSTWTAVAFVEEASKVCAVFPLGFIFNVPGTGCPDVTLQIMNMRRFVFDSKNTFEEDEKELYWDNWRGACWAYGIKEEDGKNFLPAELDKHFAIGFDPFYLAGRAEVRIDHFLEETLNYVRQSGGDAALLIAALAAVYADPELVEMEPRNKRGSYRFKGSVKSLPEVNIVTLHIPKRARAGWLNRVAERAGAAAQAKKREHEVEEHNRVLYRGTCDERTIRVRSHTRGDPNIGKVVKTIRVVGTLAS